MANEAVTYSVLGVYTLLWCLTGLAGGIVNVFKKDKKADGEDKVRVWLMAGKGLSFVPWLFSMASTLFSGYSVSGIVNEAYNLGWTATRWIPAGVGVYVGFLVLAPRCHALGKSRGYMTLSELVYERYLPQSSSRVWIAHVLRLVTFAALQLPVFTYLITQFQSLGTEVSTFTDGGCSSTTAVLVAAGVLLVCDLAGGMRAVAYTDVLQGGVMLIGSIVFLIIQRTELGGLGAAWEYWSNPANAKVAARVAAMQTVPTKPSIVSYFDFVLKTTVAATMFPHLATRMFCARDARVMRRGLAAMNFTFFIIQLSSMLTGWVAIYALIGRIRPGQSAYGSVLLLVAQEGGGQAFASALLLASGVCAMMSTADSALLAFSTMWVRDVFRPYVLRSASPTVHLVAGKVMGVVALAVGVGLGLKTIQTGTPDLSGLFSLQNVTPIHVAPAVWLGLHWRGLRGEAVLVGLVCGLATTIGLVFSDVNVKLAAGQDQTESGLSTALIGFFVNLGVTAIVGLAMQYGPHAWARIRRTAGRVDAAQEFRLELSAAAGGGATAITCKDGAAAATAADSHHPHHLDIGSVRDRAMNPGLWLLLAALLAFTVPFCFKPASANAWVGYIAAWPFVSLLLSGALAAVCAAAYIWLWTDYSPLPASDLPLTKTLSTGSRNTNDTSATPSCTEAQEEEEGASQKGDEVKA